MKRTEEDGKIRYEVGGEVFEMKPRTLRLRMAVAAVLAKHKEALDAMNDETRAVTLYEANEFNADLAAAALMKPGQKPGEARAEEERERLLDAFETDDEIAEVCLDLFRLLGTEQKTA